MKSSAIAYAGVLSFISTLALAGNQPANPNAVMNPNISAQTTLLTPDCATGFSKTSSAGSPTTPSYMWQCKTPVIVCPPAPPGMTGGMHDQYAIQSGKGEIFGYGCIYFVAPK